MQLSSLIVHRSLCFYPPGDGTICYNGSHYPYVEPQRRFEVKPKFFPHVLLQLPKAHLAFCVVFWTWSLHVRLWSNPFVSSKLSVILFFPHMLLQIPRVILAFCIVFWIWSFHKRLCSNSFVSSELLNKITELLLLGNMRKLNLLRILLVNKLYLVSK